ncbi:MAG: hypothetical protein ABH881_04245 [bacterium]
MKNILNPPKLKLWRASKKIIILTLLIAVVAVVSGCVKKEVKPVVDNSPNISTSDWQAYRNEEFEFEFKYPNSWYIFNCSDQYSTFLKLYASDNQNDNCNTKGGRINITLHSQEQINFYKNYDYYENTEIKIDNKIVKQVNGYYEIKGGEGESLPPKPMQKIKLSFIPYYDNYITISYNEIFKIKKGVENRGFKIDKDYNDIYDAILNSFKFID